MRACSRRAVHRNRRRGTLHDHRSRQRHTDTARSNTRLRSAMPSLRTVVTTATLERLHVPSTASRKAVDDSCWYVVALCARSRHGRGHENDLTARGFVLLCFVVFRFLVSQPQQSDVLTSLLAAKKAEALNPSAPKPTSAPVRGVPSPWGAVAV